MTTIVPFTPNDNAPFQFQATLDGAAYTVVITWNLWGQRYYVNVYDISQNLIVSIGMAGSPTGADINLVAGYFTTSTLVFRAPSSQFEVNP